MGRNKVLSRDEVVKNLKRQLTECDRKVPATSPLRKGWVRRAHQ